MKALMPYPQALRGYITYHCLYTGVKLGLFQLFLQHEQDGLDDVGIVAILSLNKRYVNVWLQAALYFQILVKRNGRYWVHSDYLPFLCDPSSTMYQGEMIQIFVEYLSHDMKAQEKFIRDGGTFPFSEHDSGLIRLISRRGTLRGRTFLETYVSKRSVVAALLESPGRRVCDLGCGTGAFLRAIAEKFPNVDFIGIDADATSIDIANSENTLTNLQFIRTSLETIGLDRRSFDIITIVLVLHEIDSKVRRSVLKKCRTALKSGGFLLIMEFPFPENEGEFNSPAFQMGMIDQYFEMIWGSQHIGWSEQKHLVEEAGFLEVNRQILSDNTYMIIEARCP